MPKLKVLDLFSGLEGWSEPWRKRGHDVYRIEINPRFNAEHRDIMDFDISQLPWAPDVILASPPCTSFTVMQIGRNWNYDRTPKTSKAKLGLILLNKTLQIIQQIEPKFFIIENPVGMMRKMEQMAKFERRSVTYCQYGEQRMKPTDLWGGFPESLMLKPMCKRGSPCHTSAPRGSMTGTQGMDSSISAKIPEELSLAICIAAEKDINKFYAKA